MQVTDMWAVLFGPPTCRRYLHCLQEMEQRVFNGDKALEEVGAAHAVRA